MRAASNLAYCFTPGCSKPSAITRIMLRALRGDMAPLSPSILASPIKAAWLVPVMRAKASSALSIFVPPKGHPFATRAGEQALRCCATVFSGEANRGTDSYSSGEDRMRIALPYTAIATCILMSTWLAIFALR